MPVVVTGATGLIGTAAVPAFVRVSPQVRAYVRRSEGAETLRAMGAKVAIGAIDDVPTLEAVMSGAHTVCHLVGGLDEPTPDAYGPTIVGSTEAVLAAAGRAGVRRVLYISCPGASSSASNPFLRAKGEAEEAIRASGMEHAIIRCTHVYGLGSRWLQEGTRAARGPVAVVLGTGSQVLAPVFVGDVADVLAAADSREATTTGTWGLEGPDRVTADQLADLLAGRRRRKMHIASGGSRHRLRPHLGFHVNPARFEVLSADSLADAPDAAAEFGVSLTPLREGLARARAT